MHVGNKLFPYPTINNEGERSCFKETTYTFNCNEDNDGQNYILENACISINNKYIEKLMNEGYIGAGLIVECSSTVFRKMYEISLTPQTIKINIGNLRDRVVISCYLYAKKDITDFKDDDFLEDYRGFSFKIEKNDIIAIDDGFTTIIDYDESTDKKVSSIFQIIRNRSVDTMTIENKTRKIVISLPDEEFKHYDFIRKQNSYFQNIIFSMFAIPALTYCLKEFQDNILAEQYDMDTVEMNYTWFISVKNAYKKQYNENLTEEIFKNIDVLEIAQKLLNNGTLKGIKDLVNIPKLNQTGGEEYE